MYDKVIGRKIVKISGKIPAANFISIPRSKTSVKNLALTGRYVYAQMQVAPGNLLSIHLDYLVTSERSVGQRHIRLSVSNLFKADKIPSESSMQLSINPTAKWTVLCLDIKKLLESNYNLFLQTHQLRSLTLCSSVSVRSLYTSDIKYSSKTLPKEMTFKLGKEEVWSDFYDWVSLPVGDEENEPNTPLVPVEETKAPRAKSTTATRKPGYKRQPLKPKGETVKKPKNTGPNAESCRESQSM